MLVNGVRLCWAIEFSFSYLKFIFHNTIEPNILILSKLILRIPKYIKVTYMSDFYFSRYQIKVYMLMYVTVHTKTKKPSSIFLSTLAASDEDSHNVSSFEKQSK